MPTRHPHRQLPHRLGLTLLAVAGIVVSGCSLASSAPPLAELLPRTGLVADPSGPARTPTATPTTARADQGSETGGKGRVRKLRPYQMDLYRTGDHVAQYNGSWCVGASMQMMINMIEPGAPDRSRETQAKLYKVARRTSPWVETRPGASVYGWSEGLEALGYGGYEELAAGTRQAALKLAAKQMRLTKRPVGLLVWEGAHAWVMSGFKATADPRLTDDFTVTHVWIEDPWAGRTSRVWGPGLDPHTLLTSEALGRDFVKYSSMYRPQYGRDGKFVVVAPVEELSTPV